MILDKNGKRTLRIFIAIPCNNTINAGTAYDLARLTGLEGGRDIALALDQSSLLVAQRARLVERALDTNASHILWIDHDMRFPKDGLTRMLDRDTGIVAANYSTRGEPFLPTAHDPKKGYLFDMLGATGLVEVGHAGMGFMLVDTEVFKKMKRPWFAIGYNPKENRYGGEDVYFCQQAKKCGYPTYVDVELSREVRHVGELEYTLEHANLTRSFVNSARAEKAAHGT